MWYDFLEMIFYSAVGGAVGLVWGIVSGSWWLAQTIWVLIVKAFLVVIEWVDEKWYDLQIADNPLWRALVAGAVGLILALAVLWLGAMFVAPGLSCAFVLIVLFTLFVGFMADPDKAWVVPPFPWNKGGGPGFPTNL